MSGRDGDERSLRNRSLFSEAEELTALQRFEAEEDRIFLSVGRRAPFNLLYKKFGKMACRLAMRFSFGAPGRFARRRSYRIE